jgi:hypothetical protein
VPSLLVKAERKADPDGALPKTNDTEPRYRPIEARGPQILVPQAAPAGGPPNAPAVDQ